MKEILLIFGGSSTALEVREVAAENYPQFEDIWHIIGNTEEKKAGRFYTEKELPGLIRGEPRRFRYIITMSHSKIRESCEALCRELQIRPISIIHPRAFISKTAAIGQGTYIAANVSVSSHARIASHVSINFNVTVGHDAVIHQHTIVNPGARISGNVEIGRRVLVGSNSFVFQGKKIGSDTFIDAMTYVDRDVESGMICSSKSLRVFRRVV